MVIREPILEMTLEDDNSPYGGVSFYNETLGDFLYDVSAASDCPRTEKINSLLKSCGIKPIKHGYKCNTCADFSNCKFISEEQACVNYREEW